MNERIKKIVGFVAGFSVDKYLHFIAGMIISAFFALVVPTGNIWCVVPAIIAGFAKDLYDYYDYGTFDWKDVIATILGGAFIQVMSIIGYFIS